MGNYSSKLLFYNNDHDLKPKPSSSDQSVNMEKHVTPPPTRKLGIDPRSATTGIPRTPIEVNNTPLGAFKRISAVPKHLQRKQFLETDIDLVIPPLTPTKCSVTSDILEGPHTPVSSGISTSDRTKMLKNNPIWKPTIEIDEERYKILRLDPRSPAADFDRTPILLPKSFERLRARSQENLSKGDSSDKNTFHSRFSYCESLTVDSVPEIQALPHIQINAELKNTEDCNMDTKSDSSLSSYNSSIDTISESGEEITVIRNPNLDITCNKHSVVESNLSNSDSLLDKQESFLSDEYESSKNEETEVHCEKSNINNTKLTPVYDKIKVWSDSALSDATEDSVITKLDHIKLSEETGSEKVKTDVIILFDDDAVVNNSPVVKAEGENDNKKKHTTLGKKKINVRPETKTTLDEKKIFSPEKKKGVEVLKNRTPLGNRSNNGQKTQKVLGKSPQQLLRNKGMSIKMQQENTPPHRRSVARYHRNGMQWDPDSTVII